MQFFPRKHTFKIEMRVPTKFKILLQHERDKELPLSTSNNHSSRSKSSFILSFQLLCQSTLHHKCTLVPPTHRVPMSFPSKNSRRDIDVPLFWPSPTSLKVWFTWTMHRMVKMTWDERSDSLCLPSNTHSIEAIKFTTMKP
jgi:hypothetical protein